jgi:hypothetical protein
MKKNYLFLVLLISFGLSFNMYAQTGTYIGSANVNCQMLSLDATLDSVDVILQNAGPSYSLVVDQIDLGDGTFTPIIEIVNVTATPNGPNYTLTAPDMNITIPELTVMGNTIYNVPAKVKFKDGQVSGDTLLSLKIEVTALVVTIIIDFSGENTENPLPGDGTENHKWELLKPIHFYELRYMVERCAYCYIFKHFILMKNLDFTNAQSNEPWIPIGYNAELPFNGNFDGNNKKITGLKIRARSGIFPDMPQEYLGVFGCVLNGSIENLGVEDVDLDFDESSQGADVYAGGLVGLAGNNSRISNCFVTGKVKSAPGFRKSHVGGLIGRVEDESSLSDCFSTADVDGSSDHSSDAGGIAGSISSSILENCYSTGAVRSASDHDAAVGGIVGEIEDNGYGRKPRVSECAALNPSLDLDGSGEQVFGRIVAKRSTDPVDTLSSNIGFDEMKDPNGESSWEDTDTRCLTCSNGSNISKDDISADGTLGNRFREPKWKTANGKLPGLFEETVEMPEFLKPLYIKTITNSGLLIYPNPTTGELLMENGEWRIMNVEVFDVFGRSVSNLKSQISNQKIDISNLANGVYFLKIQTENGVEVTKIVKN